ncbi:DNA-formamidopyrimidine glycosylase family protein [Micromonospora purpureochromogenes]|uniref:Fpg/Nei family DNA glycosylase n=1 Tax=Micromonospora purpureochromogenes TaxID=47872 RepID=UPI003405C911
MAMPEGHLIHRHARDQHADLAGQPVQVSSPQGRFDPRPYANQSVTAVEAYGKHLLYHFNDAPVLHVHLGMRGLFLRFADPTVPPRRGTRLRLAGPEVAYDLIAPIRCEPLPSEAERALRTSLGPDPLRDDADPVEAVRRLAAAHAPVGTALLDQTVWAGIGNAWRAELLFLAELAPDAPSVGDARARRLWELAVEYLALGRDAGQVVSDPAVPDERWVYKRERCRRCGSPVRTWQLGGRMAYACPVDQPAGSG